MNGVFLRLLAGPEIEKPELDIHIVGYVVAFVESCVKTAPLQENPQKWVRPS